GGSEQPPLQNTSGVRRGEHLYNHAARNGTTFFFLTTEISAFCGGRKFSFVYFMASSTNCRPELRPSLRLMLSRWVSIVFTLRFSSCAIFFVPSHEPTN